jgi:hypothetical protein
MTSTEKIASLPFLDLLHDRQIVGDVRVLHDHLRVSLGRAFLLGLGFWLGLARGSLLAIPLGLHDLVVFESLHAGDHDPVTRLHAVNDFHESVVRHAGIGDLRPERALLEGLLSVEKRFSLFVLGVREGLSFVVALANDIDPLLSLVGHQRPFGNEDRRMSVADRQPNPHNHAGHHEMVFVVELGPES